MGKRHDQTFSMKRVYRWQKKHMKKMLDIN